MEKLNVTLVFSDRDSDLANEIKVMLLGLGILFTATNQYSGSWPNQIVNTVPKIDVVILIVSNETIYSRHALMELQILSESRDSIGRPIVLPILRGDVNPPTFLVNFQYVRISDIKSTDNLLNIRAALAQIHLTITENLEKRAEIGKGIQDNSATYVETAINKQVELEKRLRTSGKRWHLIGFMTLISGVALSPAVYIFGQESDRNLSHFVSLLATDIIIIGFLAACSRYAFSLGRAYINESMKISDRIHAMEFGRFYLKSFGKNAEWSEVKEAFQHWNIDRSSSFSSIDISQIDPQIFTLIGQAAKAMAAKAKGEEKKES